MKLTIKERTYRGHSGYGPGTVPSGVKITKHWDDDIGYDYFEFERDLTPNEIVRYDLVDISTPMYAVGKIIADDMGDLNDKFDLINKNWGNPDKLNTSNNTARLADGVVVKYFDDEHEAQRFYLRHANAIKKLKDTTDEIKVVMYCWYDKQRGYWHSNNHGITDTLGNE